MIGDTDFGTITSQFYDLVHQQWFSNTAEEVKENNSRENKHKKEH